MKPKKPKKPPGPPPGSADPSPVPPAPAPTDFLLFDLFLVFTSLRNCYAVLLSADRAFYAPFVIQPIQKNILEDLIYKRAAPAADPYVLMLDTWRSLSVEVKTLKLQTHKSDGKPPEVHGRLQLKQPSGLGVNLAEVQTATSDIFIISMLLGIPIQMGVEEIGLMCARPKDASVPDQVLSEEIQRAMAIMENAQELKSLIGEGEPVK